MTDAFTKLLDREKLATEGLQVPKWLARPFQLVSLLDMVESDIFHFVRFMEYLLWLQKELVSPKRKGESLTEAERQAVKNNVEEFKRFFANYEIDISRCAKRIQNKLAEPEDVKTKLSALILELRNRINDELTERLFMYVPTEQAKYHNQWALFGSEVALKFPKANEEIMEAGNCYASGNYTACVFHLMRAVEYGARKMVIALNVQSQLGRPIELCDWGDLIKALDDGVKTLSVGSRTKMHKKTTFEFYNHAVAQFRNFKDAWRNNVSHTRKVYQSGQTKDIMDNTRQFMQHLAERLKE